MGTRGLLGFIIAGRRRASYNHFDSYPSGLGAQVAKFILGLKEGEKRAMLEHVRNVCPLSQILICSWPSITISHCQINKLVP